MKTALDDALAGRADAVPASAGLAAAADRASDSGAFSLLGQRLQVLCVDDELPCHQYAAGGARVRQRWHSAEVVHFEYGGHRFAIIAEVRADSVPPAAGPRSSGVMALLTNRELQIVQLICNGLLTKQVGDRLRISEFTVRSYLKTIYCKLGVRSRGAMVYAYAQAFSSDARKALAAVEQAAGKR